MDKKFFSQIRILDGGMGQELLAKGLISKGTLWSASANLDKKFEVLNFNQLSLIFPPFWSVFLTN